MNPVGRVWENYYPYSTRSIDILLIHYSKV